MSTGLPAAPKGGMNLRKPASRSGGIFINDRPLSTQASESKTPDPPAPVMMNDIFTLGRRQHLQAAGELQQIV
jgi:hypothetical protein